MKKILFILSIFNCLSTFSQTGIFTVNGNLTKGTGLVTSIDIENASGPGTGHDQVIVNGDLTIGGVLNIAASTTIGTSLSFEIFSYTGVLNGTFSSINWPSVLMPFWLWNIDYGVLVPGKITIYGANSPLPINLTEFDGYASKSGNQLIWKTSSEVNNDYFLIEYSLDGQLYEPLAKVKGGGDSSSEIVYHFMHNQVNSEISYYRLKQVDFDGHFVYSQSISIVKKNMGHEISIYPNPTSGVIYLSFPVENIKIYNSFGKLLYVKNGSITEVDLHSFPNGVYYISINDIHQKIILNK